MTANEAIKYDFLEKKAKFPIVIYPDREDTDIISYTARNQNDITELLFRYGGILFRGFRFNGIPTLEQVTDNLLGQLINYVDRGSGRSSIKGRIFTASDASGKVKIPLHCESSFTDSWPAKIFFYCHKFTCEGGETPLADVSRVFSDLHPEITDIFRNKNILYVRTFDESKSWKYVFQVDSREDLEAYCKKSNIEHRWLKNDTLRTAQVRPAILVHPRTNEEIWFNQVDNFYVTRSLIDKINPFPLKKKLYRASFYGDGTQIPHALIKRIREAYGKNTIYLKWQLNDLLVLDNMKIAHGRMPFSGEREIWTGMSEPTTWKNVSRTQ